VPQTPEKANSGPPAFLRGLDLVLTVLAELPAAVVWWPVVWLLWLIQLGRRRVSVVEAQLGNALAPTIFLPFYLLLRAALQPEEAKPAAVVYGTAAVVWSLALWLLLRG
jgi:hypothetical protein